MHRLTVPFGRAKRIFQSEGLLPLLRIGFAFLVGCIFRYKTYYLTERSIQSQKMNPNNFLPQIPNLNCRFVTTNQQADQLLANGFVDFRQYCINGRKRLDNEAIAFRIFAGREPAYMIWTATSEAQKIPAGPPPTMITSHCLAISIQ